MHSTIIWKLQIIKNDTIHCKIQYIAVSQNVVFETWFSLKCFEPVQYQGKKRPWPFQFTQHSFYKRVCNIMKVHCKIQWFVHFWRQRKHAQIEDMIVFCNIFVMAKNTHFQNASKNHHVFWRAVRILILVPRTTFSNSLLYGSLSSTTKPFFFVPN